MNVTLEVSEHLMSDLHRKARANGKDPAQFIQEVLENAPDIPAHLDPARCITSEELLQRAREKHGFPAAWGVNPKPLTEDQWEQLDAAFAPETESVK